MSLLMIERARFVPPASETSVRGNGTDHRVGDPPVDTMAPLPTARASAPKASDDAARASQDGGRAADHSPAVTVVTNSVLAPTVGHSAMRAPETPRPPVPGGARLVRVGRGDAFAIRDGTAMIGRDRESDLVVSGPAVSRRHSIVRRMMHGYVVTDVSRNGTYVNGRRVRGARLLRTGDLLRIGEEEFRFEVSQGTAHPGVPLSALLTQRLAQLRSRVPLASTARHVAARLRLRMKPVLPRLRSAARVGWTGVRRTLLMMSARGSFAWAVLRPRSQAVGPRVLPDPR